jgi:hypothetical protein
MPQFRLTKKFANDCKIQQLLEPTITKHPLDDWFIDYMLAYRKKIAVITHAKTAFTFFISYSEAGGAKNIIPCFKNKLRQFFETHSLSTLALETEKLFAGKHIYTKTVDRKILGNMNDFIRCATPYSDETSPIDWQERMTKTNMMPIYACKPNGFYPLERFNELLGLKHTSTEINFKLKI